MESGDYEAILKATREWARIAATPQYRETVERARRGVSYGDILRAAEKAHTADPERLEKVRQQAVRAVESNPALRANASALSDAGSRATFAAWEAFLRASATPRVLEAASSMQPALDRFLRSEPAWTDAAAKGLSNRHVLDVLEKWLQLAQRQAEGQGPVDTPTADPDAILDLEALTSIAASEEIAAVDLDAFEEEISGIESLDEMLNSAADQLVTSHPFMTRSQARSLVIVVAYVAWLGVVIGLGYTVAPFLVLLGLTVSGAGLDAPKVGKAAGRAVDRLPSSLFAPDEGEPDTLGDHKDEQD